MRVGARASRMQAHGMASLDFMSYLSTVPFHKVVSPPTYYHQKPTSSVFYNSTNNIRKNPKKKYHLIAWKLIIKFLIFNF